jgi:hypothetical protein
MENPAEYDRLTAALAAKGFRKPRETWRFLLSAGLVPDWAGGTENFERIVDEVRDGNSPPGPSEAYRVATRLIQAGWVLNEALEPDPTGQRAQDALDALRVFPPGKWIKFTILAIMNIPVAALSWTTLRAVFEEKPFLDSLWPDGAAMGLVIALVVAGVVTFKRGITDPVAGPRTSG